MTHTVYVLIVLSYLGLSSCLNWKGDEGDVHLLKMAANAPPLVKKVPDDATEMLLAAIETNDHASARDALEGGADLEWRNLTGFTPLLRAAELGHSEVLAVLLEAGPDLEAVSESSDRAVHYAAANGRDAALVLLATAGADLAAAGYLGRTPLDRAYHSGHRTTASLIYSLLHDMERFGARDGNSTSALWDAVVSNDPIAAAKAIAHGADIEDRNSTGFTPLHWACADGYTLVAGVLLKAGARKEAVDSDGDRPLHDAAIFGRDETVALLAVAGADLRARGHHGRTALIRAAVNGRRSTVALLRSLGAWK